MTAMAVDSAGAQVEGARSLFFGPSGRWAGERMLQALSRGEEISPACLRTLDTLRRDDWIALDTALVEAGVTRLAAVADLISAGLTTPLPNAMGKTVFGYEKVGDMDPATVSMDGMARSENDTAEFSFASIPVPITHKDFFLNIRRIAASRTRGEAIDVTQARVAGRKVAEEIERMTLLGGKTFAGLPIYGYTTHPNRNTVAFGTNGNWVQAAKTGENIIADVQAMMALAEGDKYYGPYWLYVSRNASSKLEGDYKAAGTITTRARILELDGISAVRYLDMLTANTVLLIQPTSDVVTLLDGESMQTVQWDVNGGFGVNFKAFAIQVPLIRADSLGNSGIVHMS
jgi:hypothetical protein